MQLQPKIGQQVKSMKYHKIEQFQVEIRRKHKQLMMEQWRKKCFSNLSAHGNNHEPEQLNDRDMQQWVRFCESDSDTVPQNIINKISRIHPTIQDFHRKIPNLNPKKSVNIFFVGLVAGIYDHVCDLFIAETINNLPHLQHTTNQQLQWINKATNLHNIYEVNMFMWCNYLKKAEQVEQRNISSIQYYFFKWWNDQSLDLSYGLCSEVCCFLLQYNNPDTAKQIKYMSTELMRIDRSMQTYKLIFKLISMQDNKQTIILLLLEENFQQFLLNGTYKVQLLPCTLSILGKIIVCYNYYQHIEGILHKILDNLCQMYIEENHNLTNSLQRNFLHTFYNIIFQQFPGTLQKFRQFEFKIIYRKTNNNNIIDFIDLAVIALVRYPDKILYDKILGNDLKLTALIIDAFDENKINDKIEFFKIIESFIETMQQAVSQNVSSELCYKSIFKIYQYFSEFILSDHKIEVEQLEILESFLDSSKKFVNEVNMKFPDHNLYESQG